MKPLKPWPAHLQLRRFRPSEAADLTGVSPKMQRMWMSRYGFDWRTALEAVETDGLSALSWTWTGIGRLAALADISQVLPITLALPMLGEGAGEEAKRHSEDAFGNDWRAPDEGGDVMLFQEWAVEAGQVPRLRPYGQASDIAKALSEFHPYSGQRLGQFHAYNLSALQRRLASKIGLGDE